MPEQDFERAFATLAYAELEQLAPGLMPFLVGFQLVKKSDDDSHAVGIFGFKVGDQWYYATPFWLNGKIKGFDLLYIVSQDLFVPLSESWINYVTNRRPFVMGESEPQKLQQLGVTTPDFYQYRRSPLTKTSSTLEEWCKPGLMLRSPNDPKFDGIVKRCSLDTLCERNPEFAATLLRTMEKSATFANAVFKFYPPTQILSVAKRAQHKALFKAAAEEVPAPNMISTKDGEKVKVLYGTGNIGKDEFHSLSADEQEKLMRGDSVVQDGREPNEKSEVYANPEAEKVYQNPSLSGLWRVLMRDGEYVDGLVACAPLPIGAGDVPANAAVVVNMENKNGKDFTLVSKQDVYANAQVDTFSWYDTFDKMRSAQNVGRGDIGILINKDMKCSLPFKVLNATAKVDGTKDLCVQVCDDIRKPRGYMSKTDTGDTVGGCQPVCCGDSNSVNYYYDTWNTKCEHDNSDAPFDSQKYKNRCRGHHIKLMTKPCSPTNVGDTLLISADDFKFLPLKTKDKDDYSLKGTLDVGSEADVNVKLKKMSFHKMAIEYDGHEELAVTFRETKTPRMSSHQALTHLVKVAGCTEADARLLIKAARVKTRVQVLVKTGQPMSLAPQPSQYDSTYGAPVQMPYENKSEFRSPEAMTNRSENTWLDPVVDPTAQRQAMQAADNDQKDVFDISLLSGLIKTTQFDDKVKEFVKDMILGNDRVGRVLFMYYWHYDKFVEQYGDEDMVELEDLLRNVFESTGDLILFLKQKSIEPEAIATGSVLNL